MLVIVRGGAFSQALAARSTRGRSITARSICVGFASAGLASAGLARAGQAARPARPAQNKRRPMPASVAAGIGRETKGGRIMRDLPRIHPAPGERRAVEQIVQLTGLGVELPIRPLADPAAIAGKEVGRAAKAPALRVPIVPQIVAEAAGH